MVLKDLVPFHQGDQRFESSSLQRGVRAQREAEDACGRAVPGCRIEDAKVANGDFVLIPAASSSVGLAAIQIAKYVGATTIALTRTSTKKQQLLDAGAVHVIATEEVDLVGEVMRITNGQGARVAFDPVGGPSFPKLVSALAFGGIIYIYGLLSTGVTPLPVLEMIAKVPTIKAHNIWLTSGDETRRKAAPGARAVRGHGPKSRSQEPENDLALSRPTHRPARGGTAADARED